MKFISHARLKQELRYDPHTGSWHPIRTKGRHKIKRKPTKLRKYQIITAAGQNFQSHRLAWFYMTSEWPVLDIDHIDGNPSNNAWSNLRLATRSNNLANSKISKTNTSGYKGVCWHKCHHKWMAYLGYQNKQRFLGLFKTKNAAVAARVKAAQELFGEFARHA